MIKNIKETTCHSCSDRSVSIRKSRCHYICPKCGADKSFTDFLEIEAVYIEAIESKLNEKEKAK